MGLDELAEQFKALIQNDDAEMNEQERHSKEAIWDSIDLPQKERSIFPYWQVAAAGLLLLLAGTAWFFKHNANQQEARFALLQNELQATKLALNEVQLVHELSTIKNGIKESINLNPNESHPVAQVKELERVFIKEVVHIRDTVILEKPILSKENIQIIRDTVYIEVPAKSPTKYVDLDEKEEELLEQKPKIKSSKMEFVFGKKQLEKPKKQNSFTKLNEHIMARETNGSKKRNVISIPINN